MKRKKKHWTTRQTIWLCIFNAGIQSYSSPLTLLSSGLIVLSHFCCNCHCVIIYTALFNRQNWNSLALTQLISVACVWVPRLARTHYRIVHDIEECVRFSWYLFQCSTFIGSQYLVFICIRVYVTLFPSLAYCCFLYIFFPVFITISNEQLL